jgi:hypothetical protein
MAAISFLCRFAVQLRPQKSCSPIKLQRDLCSVIFCFSTTIAMQLELALYQRGQTYDSTAYFIPCMASVFPSFYLLREFKI